MGIFSFLTGERQGGDRNEAGRQSAADTWDRGAQSGPAAREPGNGIPDVEPAGRDAAAQPPDGEPRPGGGDPAESWWQSGVPGTAGSPASEHTRNDTGPMWDLDALLEPTPVSPATAEAIARVGPAHTLKTLELKPKIVDALCTIFDPEIPVNIYELGLIYEIIVDADARVLIRMTLTSPACPSAQQLPSEVQYKVRAVDGVTEAAVDVVWDPPWTKDMMSDAAKLALGIW